MRNVRLWYFIETENAFISLLQFECILVKTGKPQTKPVHWSFETATLRNGDVLQKTAKLPDEGLREEKGRSIKWKIVQRPLSPQETGPSLQKNIHDWSWHLKTF